MKIKEEIDEMSIEVGLGEFTGRKLANANFHQLKLENGLGDVLLDMSGEWRIPDVELEAALGVITEPVTGSTDPVPADLDLDDSAIFTVSCCSASPFSPVSAKSAEMITPPRIPFSTQFLMVFGIEQAGEERCR